jgi:Tfp pilus assembly protein PilE
MKKYTNQKMKGLTLIEALLFLGIAAVVIVAAVAFYNNATSSNKLNNVKSQVQAISGGVQSLYASQSTYTSVSTSLVVNAGLAPQNTINGNAMVNPWGGAIDVTSPAPGRHFEIEIDNIPADACVNLLSSGMSNEGNMIQMRVNNAATYAPGTDPDPSVAIAACSSATNNEIEFWFR